MSSQVDPAVAAAANGAPPSDFLSSLPEDLRADPSLSKFKSNGDLGKSYLELQKKMGSAIKVPGADAKPEDWDKIYTTLGRPEKPEGYEFTKQTLPEGVNADTELEVAAKSWAHKAGLHPRQAQALYDEFSKFQMDRIAKFNGERTAGVEAIKKEWGADFDKNIGLAQRAVIEVEKQLGVEAGTLKAELDATGLGNSPTLIKHFASLGSKTAESPLILGDGQVGDSEAGLLAQIDAIQRDPKHAYNDTRAEPRLREAAFQEMTRLHEQAIAARGK